MFQPIYSITDRLLANIKRISSLISELNNKRFPNIVLMKLEKTARAISTYASTSIEGNPLPLTEVKKILKSKPIHIRDSEREVLNYNQALENLNKKLKTGRLKLSLNLILKIQKQVTISLLPDFEAGKLRQKPVVVNDPITGRVVYLPPDAKDVKNLVEELIEFTNFNHNKIDPLILAGILHKQMALIHPFMDGNGRTARLTTKVLLAQMGLNTFNLFSFENYYNQNVTRYFQTVGEFGNYYELANKSSTFFSRSIDPAPNRYGIDQRKPRGFEKVLDKIDFTSWLEYFTEGIIDELLRVQEQLGKFLSTPGTELKTYHQKILEVIREKGFIADRDYAKLTNRAKATRALDFQKLLSLQLIEKRGKGRATYYILKTG